MIHFQLLEHATKARTPGIQKTGRKMIMNKQERVQNFVEDIYNKILIENNIKDKKIMDILHSEAIYFNNLSYTYLDELSDNELYDYIYFSLSWTVNNIDYFI